MNYDEALEYIHSTLRFGSKLGLERMGEFLKRLGDPHKRLKFVHVAGTNGKGSTTAMITSCLIEAGYKTGMYISPYVETFRERIQLNGELIPENELAARIGKIKAVIDQMVSEGLTSPTEFEIITALAFDYYADLGCDIAALEVGMGGRLDATNIIDTPEVSVITPISFDHMMYLGDTLAKIAYEKCGIIKPGCPVVSAFGQEPEALEVIRKTAAERGCELHIPDKAAISDIKTEVFGNSYSYGGLNIKTIMPGHHQIQNSASALTALRVMREKGWRISDRNIEEGIAHTNFGGRLEVVVKSPLCMIDGGHNPDAIDRLCEYIDSELKGRRLIVIMAMSADKDCGYCIKKMAKRASHMIMTEAVNIRALKAEEGLKMVDGITSAEAEPDILKAVQKAAALAGKDDVILACGTLFMIGDAKKALRKTLST